MSVRLSNNEKTGVNDRIESAFLDGNGNIEKESAGRNWSLIIIFLPLALVFGFFVISLRIFDTAISIFRK